MYTRPVEPTLEWIERRFGSKPLVRDANLAAFKAGLRLRRDGRAVRPPLRGPARRTRRPGTYTNITGNTALAWGLVAAGQQAKLPLFLGSLPDHAGVRHPPRAVQAQELRRPHAAGRGRDRRHRRRARRGLRWPPRRHDDERSGPRPQGRDDGPGRQPRAAAARHRHPAGRAVHRAADQDRGGRPADGHVRPPRRVAAADRRHAEPEPLLRGRPSRRPASP